MLINPNLPNSKPNRSFQSSFPLYSQKSATHTLSQIKYSKQRWENITYRLLIASPIFPKFHPSATTHLKRNLCFRKKKKIPVLPFHFPNPKLIGSSQHTQHPTPFPTESFDELTEKGNQLFLATRTYLRRYRFKSATHLATTAGLMQINLY